MAEGIGFVKFFFRKRGYPFGIAHINALFVGGENAAATYNVGCWKVSH